MPKDVVYDSMGLAFIIKLDNVAGDMGVPFLCKKGVRTSTNLEGGSGHRFGANL